MTRPRKPIWLFSPRVIRRWKPLLVAAAALPLFQTTGCFPDVIGALNFELQSMVNNMLINAVGTIIANILRL